VLVNHSVHCGFQSLRAVSTADISSTWEAPSASAKPLLAAKRLHDNFSIYYLVFKGGNPEKYVILFTCDIN
jgi:hypothetical protein